jgi:D-sedoheptulose 7-phosphate isomerase
MKSIIKDDLIEAMHVLEKFIADDGNIKSIEYAGKIIADAIKAGGRIISCGNGGSMCDAMHFAEELSGFFREPRKAIPAIAISDSSYLTCVANDHGFEFVFSRFIEANGKQGDVSLP